jgi:hypothetical protein
MSLRDFFVPKFVHSDPKVRIKFVNKTTDTILLESIIEKDQNHEVVQAANDRLKTLTVSQAEAE